MGSRSTPDTLQSETRSYPASSAQGGMGGGRSSVTSAVRPEDKPCTACDMQP